MEKMILCSICGARASFAYYINDEPKFICLECEEFISFFTETKPFIQLLQGGQNG